MADTKISALVALAGGSVATGDLLVAVDISDTSMAPSGTDKKLTMSALGAALVALALVDAPGAAAAAQAASQPLDADLTAIAALTTTVFGRGLLALADAPALLTAAGVDADLATFSVPASTTISAFLKTVLDDANAAAVLTTLGLDTDLLTFSVPASTTVSTFIAGLLDDANLGAVLTTLGLDTDLATFTLPASTTISTFGASLIDDADATTARATLGLTTDITALQTQSAVALAQQAVIRAGQQNYGVLTGGLLSPNATPTKLDLAAGVDAVGTLNNTYAAQTAISTTVASLADATNPKWVIVELDSSDVVQFNQGTAAAAPAFPALTAGRVAHGFLYVPANATNVDTLLTTNNGLAKLIDCRAVRPFPLEGRTAVADAAYAAVASDREISYTSLSASRIVTLPAANAVPQGWTITVADESGSAVGGSSPIKIQVKPAGSDTVNGVAAATNWEEIREPYGSMTLRSDGSTKWVLIAVVPHVRTDVYSSTAASGYRKSLIATTVQVLCIGGGGGGGAGEKRATSTVRAGGGGGGAGAYTEAILDASNLSVTETPTVGTGGAANAATTVTGNGAAGNAGNDSSFTVGGTIRVIAKGGGAGGGGTGGGGGTAGTGGVGTYSGGAGGAGADANGPIPAVAGQVGVGGGGYQMLAPGGGGGGGGATGANASVARADGGNGAMGVQVGGTGGVIVGGITAGAGSAATTAKAYAGGGGGGGSTGGTANPSTGNQGGAGGAYGGGGAGGGDGTGTGNGGAGGPGADGIVIVRTYR